MAEFNSNYFGRDWRPRPASHNATLFLRCNSSITVSLFFYILIILPALQMIIGVACSAPGAELVLLAWWLMRLQAASSDAGDTESGLIA